MPSAVSLLLSIPLLLAGPSARSFGAGIFRRHRSRPVQNAEPVAGSTYGVVETLDIEPESGPLSPPAIVGVAPRTSPVGSEDNRVEIIDQEPNAREMTSSADRASVPVHTTTYWRGPGSAPEVPPQPQAFAAWLDKGPEQLTVTPVEAPSREPRPAEPTPANTVAPVEQSTIPVRVSSSSGCAGCGQSAWSSGSYAPLDPVMTGGCGGAGCGSARPPCYPCEHNTVAGRFVCLLYECICCPDPCYEPRWVPAANAAFFVDSVRPQTQTRFRWERGIGLRTPDRAEYFWARPATYAGIGPLPPVPPPITAPFADTDVQYDELSMYTEASFGKFGTFVDYPYRSIDPNVTDHYAGFGDLKIGTKTLLYDCELLQITFQFTHHIPVGISFKGLGTGHMTMEPSLLLAVKLHPRLYFQGQLAEWIPISADASHAGAIFRHNYALNSILYQFNPDLQLLGTLELAAWSFQDGLYVNPDLDPANPGTYFLSANGTTYLQGGWGFRLSFCNRLDFGLATIIGFGEESWTDATLRTDLRVLF